MPILSTSTTAEGITSIGEYVFRTALPETKAIPFEGQRVVSVYRPKSAAVLYARDDDYAVTGGEAFLRAARDQGLTLLAEETCATSSARHVGPG